MRWLVKILFIILFGTTLSACATVALAPPTEDQQAKTFKVSEQQANIYVFRRWAFVGSALLLQISLDGLIVGQIAPGTYFLFQVDPGEHTVASSTVPHWSWLQWQVYQSVIQLYAESGTNYFIETYPEWPETSSVRIDARTGLNQVAESEARQVIQDLSLVVDFE